MIIWKWKGVKLISFIRTDGKIRLIRVILMQGHARAYGFAYSVSLEDCAYGLLSLV